MKIAIFHDFQFTINKSKTKHLEYFNSSILFEINFEYWYLDYLFIFYLLAIKIQFHKPNSTIFI